MVVCFAVGLVRGRNLPLREGPSSLSPLSTSPSLAPFPLSSSRLPPLHPSSSSSSDSDSDSSSLLALALFLDLNPCTFKNCSSNLPSNSTHAFKFSPSMPPVPPLPSPVPPSPPTTTSSSISRFPPARSHSIRSMHLGNLSTPFRGLLAFTFCLSSGLSQTVPNAEAEKMRLRVS